MRIEQNDEPRKGRDSYWKSFRVLALFVVLVVSAAVLTDNVHRAHAAGEVYTLYMSSSRLQESNTPGEILYLNVTNAALATRYQFTFVVQDPTGASKNSVNATTTTSTSFVLSVVYPRDFGAGTSMKYVGNYTTVVNQNQPNNKANVANGQFQVGLTDIKIYQRTSLIFVRAIGYAANENVTTSLVQGSTPAPFFPKSKLADVSGNLNFSWRVPASEAVGSYTLSLTGSSTLKSPLDQQALSLVATTILIPGITVRSPAIPRTLTEQLVFAPQYPDGERVQTGNANIRVIESDGSTVLNSTGSYDSLIGTFRAPVYLPKNAMTGIWIATIDPNHVDDGYGNVGPILTSSVGFNVQPATLNVSIIGPAIGLKTYNPGEIIPLYASVNYPDGSSFSSGSVIAKLTHDGVPVGAPVLLSYIPGQQAWAGTYQVSSNDPAGIWLLTVDASDQVGDTGEGTYSAAVSVPPSTPTTWLTTSNFLLIAAIAAAIALFVLLWAVIVARRRVTHAKVKLDMSVVDREVARIQDSQFFQNVRKQVEEKKSSPNPRDDSSQSGT